MWKVITLLLVGLVVYADAQVVYDDKVNSRMKRATAILRPDPKYGNYPYPKAVYARGIVEMVQPDPDGPVTIMGKMVGLKKNSLHGFHVHQLGNYTDGCQSLGAHFNPDQKTHGASEDEERHAGDLGNIMSNWRGCADIYIVDKSFSLSGDRSIIGRSLIVHENEDDLGKGGHPLSKANGNAGDRWSCGIIGMA